MLKKITTLMSARSRPATHPLNHEEYVRQQHQAVMRDARLHTQVPPRAGIPG